MNFTHKCQFGLDRYFPVNEKATEFLEAFPCSRGKRKSLSKNQYKLLENLGLIPNKNDVLYKNPANNLMEITHEHRVNDRL